MNAYRKCKTIKKCAEAIYWPSVSAGVKTWKLRNLSGCRFANIKTGKCILRKKDLAVPLCKNEITTWEYGAGEMGGTNSCKILIKTYKNKNKS